MLLDPVTTQYEHKRDLKTRIKHFLGLSSFRFHLRIFIKRWSWALLLLFSFLRLLLFFYLYCESHEKRPGCSRRARNRRPGSIWEPDTYSFQVIFATFVAMDDSGSWGCLAGRKEEDSPSLAFLLNHLPLCATNSRSSNLLQNF